MGQTELVRYARGGKISITSQLDLLVTGKYPTSDSAHTVFGLGGEVLWESVKS